MEEHKLRAEKLAKILTKSPQVVEPGASTSLRPSPTPKAGIAGVKSKGGSQQGI
ncbi:MAG: hypothetical protein K0T99_03915 [Alphaproteobacteria bacterium]|nr:hypothetical protein [Alphaproteobacteria bacterium]